MKAYTIWSLPARGAWIEILRLCRFHGLRESLPARGAWIEIGLIHLIVTSILSLPARGAWIEIHIVGYLPAERKRRSPHGERGLK